MRLLGQRRRVGGDLAAQLVVLGLPVHRVDGNQEREKTRPLDVTQELEPEPASFVRAFDDAGNVGDDERASVASTARRRGSGASVVNG